MNPNWSEFFDILLPAGTTAEQLLKDIGARIEVNNNLQCDLSSNEPLPEVVPARWLHYERAMRHAAFEAAIAAEGLVMAPPLVFLAYIHSLTVVETWPYRSTYGRYQTPDGPQHAQIFFFGDALNIGHCSSYSLDGQMRLLAVKLP